MLAFLLMVAFLFINVPSLFELWLCTLATGTVEAVRPTAEMMATAEASPALNILQAEPSAVGAYDCLPMASTAAVYTFDTASEVFMLHSAKV